MVDSHKRAAGPFGGVKHAAGSIRDILEDWNERPGETPAGPSDEQRRKSA